jgi:membrane protein YqaA with SNARE-associated domain
MIDPSPLPESAPTKKNIVRRLYDWVLSWAETRYGTPALFVLAFVESSFFPIPPDVLQIALSVGKPKRAFWYATVCLTGSVLGAFLGFLIGYAFWAATQDFFYNTHIIDRETFAIVAGDEAAGIVRENPEDAKIGLYQEHGFWAILITAPTPIPYKLFTIAAGVCGISLWTLFLASVIGRSARFYPIAAIMYFFGPTVKTWIDRYFNVLMVIFAILFIGGLAAVKLLS